MRKKGRKFLKVEHTRDFAEKIAKLHEELGSFLAIEEKTGYGRSSCHLLLKEFGIRVKGSPYSEDEDREIISYYESHDRETFNLDEIANKLGRPRTNVSRRARQLGVSNIKRGRNAEYRKNLSDRTKKFIAKNGHPRGMAGKRHTGETKKAISKTSKKRWRDKTDEQKKEWVLRGLKTRAKNGTLTPPRHKVSWRGGWRTIGGVKKYYRSRWEANYARYLEWLKVRGEISEWHHEPDTFWFEKIKRGTRSYLPDFRVHLGDGSVEYHEVKGWMDNRSKTKLRRMAKYYPEVKLDLIDAKRYRAIESKMKHIIPEWEHKDDG